METLAQRLAAAGHRVVASPAEAQVIVFNSCAVTTGAERDSRKRIGALHRANGAAQIAVTGCLATLAPAQTAELPGVSLVVENERKDLLPLLLEPWSAALGHAGRLAAPPARRDAAGISRRGGTAPAHPRLRQGAGWLQQTAAPSASSPRCAGRAAAGRWPRSWPRCSNWRRRGCRKRCSPACTWAAMAATWPAPHAPT
jgi:hypothetical protein